MSGNVARETAVAAGSVPTRRERCITRVEQTELPPLVAEIADEYERRIGDRDRFVWKWIHNLFDAFTLSCVPERNLESVKTTKTILTVFVTVLDDVADRHGDGATFEQARRIPHARAAVDRDAPGVDADVIGFAESLWDLFRSRLSAAPRFEEFDQLLSFDARSVLSAMEYAHVLNENPSMANLSGTRHYGPHNMVMFPYADVDLMYSPDFDARELGELRGLLWELQPMARIGNWLTTWERELREADVSAGVVVDAIERGLVDPETVAEAGDAAGDAIETIRNCGIDRRFRREWRARYAEVRNREIEMESVDADRLVEGMRTVMRHHLASYGRK